jgi:hypothetical protein
MVSTDVVKREETGRTVFMEPQEKIVKELKSIKIVTLVVGIFLILALIATGFFVFQTNKNVSDMTNLLTGEADYGDEEYIEMDDATLDGSEDVTIDESEDVTLDESEDATLDGSDDTATDGALEAGGVG